MARHTGRNQLPNPLHVWFFWLAEFYADSIPRQADSQINRQRIFSGPQKKAGRDLPQPPP
jgi:hypothetical protein